MCIVAKAELGQRVTQRQMSHEGKYEFILKGISHIGKSVSKCIHFISLSFSNWFGTIIEEQKNKIWNV